MVVFCNARRELSLEQTVYLELYCLFPLLNIAGWIRSLLVTHSVGLLYGLFIRFTFNSLN